MKIDRSDIIAFVLGVSTSVLANILWEKYKEKQGQLAYGEKTIIKEMQSAIDGLKEDIKKII
jgi:predicted AlkP superfamily phosphohydrolase/phosphomutase